MKIWCETCEGLRVVSYEIQNGGFLSDGFKKCDCCKGKGYTEITDANPKELQNIADKWTDHKTQEELHLWRCVKLIAENGNKLDFWNGNPENWFVQFRDRPMPMPFLKWVKQQGVE
jgi:hypothetical protein